MLIAVRCPLMLMRAACAAADLQMQLDLLLVGCLVFTSQSSTHTEIQNPGYMLEALQHC
jgi:hypothetical protein